ncbi:hypothetical protein BOVAC16_4435 [Bacteroides ovatus]|nr:hypothetical protein BOVAC16_4435 [Bacteroides ovatus]
MCHPVTENLKEVTRWSFLYNPHDSDKSVFRPVSIPGTTA